MFGTVNGTFHCNQPVQFPSGDQMFPVFCFSPGKSQQFETLFAQSGNSRSSSIYKIQFHRVFSVMDPLDHVYHSLL